MTFKRNAIYAAILATPIALHSASVMAQTQEPVLVTSYPLIYGLGVESVAVRDLCLDGHRDEQPAGIGACRGAEPVSPRPYQKAIPGRSAATGPCRR